ncbi:uncharacterized protein Z518_02416 [Rhinocladiella mackenziei CBS 650.93]|uniref:Rhinocladiella mackenziei CBS 650.93 unplaced genomic scaffold supercont1.2, whole genome shotgun sequence n=1 Tax=Rhinocladiella mackenziei CBS 650.93 TaxID=1442369 RepID=A0A0D2FZM6_9EURO|nr:uncharacterized protein Z518_02416 [Rhinocladiella mackenziei CBS 650.93]KIX07762.1 hypothetical protein Z518_02416 [Rhinocladiella mackenziei CBS 650.93]
MFSKPFKPLTIRKPVPAEEYNDFATPPKRRRLSPPEDTSKVTFKTARQTTPALTSPRNDGYNSEKREVLKNVPNPPSSVKEPKLREGDGIESVYYSILWRLPTNKKNKTWTDDGVLVISGGFATLHNNSGKTIGRTAFSSPLLPGSNLSIGGKEVEVDSCITKDEYLEIVKSGAGSKKVEKNPQSKVETTQVFPPQQKRFSIQAQMEAQIQREKTHIKKRDLSRSTRVEAFKQPLKDTTILPQGSSENPTPRHDPNASGALVFKRPRIVPLGRQIVDVVLDPLIEKLLRPHQKDGVKFLYECVMGLRNFDGQGCILADDMGLGKTLTTIALLWTLLRQNSVYKDPPVVRKALIVCPVSLIRNWKREFQKWLGSDRLGVLEFEDQNTRLSNFDGKVYQVMIIGYERLRMIADDLAKGHPIDIVVCDEGHRLKTMKNKNVQAIESLNTPRRIILSGTPIQNDLSEFYAMVNFVNDGCLGSQKAFVRDFEMPILKSRQPGASEEDMERGQEASEELARTTSPFILRRTADILADFLPPRTEYVLFCRPTQAQAKIYRTVLKSPMFHNALCSNESTFQLITILKKLCNSPALMDPKLGGDDLMPSSSLTTLSEMLPEGLSKLYNNSVSCKIRLLDQLLQQIRYKTDEKIVVISNYTSTLNLIEQLLVNSNLAYLRLDGTVAAKKRQGLVDQFNRSKPGQCFAFLLSAKAGGVGINLTGASRLVLFDVDWNPATDDQAVARIHRQGQKRHCKIYRFLIKGGLEERIWQRQVVKRALADSIMQGGSAASSGSLDAGGTGKGRTSPFSQDELKDLFRLDESDGLRTHDLIGCGCKGAGREVEESFVSESATALDQGTESFLEDSEEELPKASISTKRKSPSPGNEESVNMHEPNNAKSPSTRTELEAERQELMKYSHFDTSNLSQSDKDEDLVSRILAGVDDACLEHVLSLGDDVTGGGGVSYVFKKTNGSQAL